MAYIIPKTLDGVTDPSLQNMFTRLLCNFDGTEGQTTLTDSSPYGQVLTASGNAHITTTNPKFPGKGCLLLDGNSSSKVTITNTDRQIWLGPNSFSIEFFFRLDSVATQQVLLSSASTADNTGFIFWVNTNGKPSIWWTQDDGTGGGFWQQYNADVVLSTGATSWHHIVFARDSQTMMMFVDGTRYATGWRRAKSGTINLMQNFWVGHYPYSNSAFSGPRSMAGAISDLRINIGKTLYYDVPTLTVPTASMPCVHPVPGVDGEIRADGGNQFWYYNATSGFWQRTQTININQRWPFG